MQPNNFNTTWEVIIQMFNKSREDSVNAKRIEYEEFVSHASQNFNCDVCGNIMRDPQLCRNDDCNGGVCRNCIEGLVVGQVAYVGNQPGARCKGKCRKRFYARDLAITDPKTLKWFFWAQLKCSTCGEKYLMDEKAKHLSRC